MGPAVPCPARDRTVLTQWDVSERACGFVGSDRLDFRAGQEQSRNGSNFPNRKQVGNLLAGGQD